ncbi:glutamine synthetase family protein [Nocardioides soli]|uniref:Glutamine synthetase n=1 Tax=Nocardioides soli TaxID=1036020 RepID=A0A7W4VWN0_9ACTN|nr:glutamine synthetase [Nocardioides soli]
MNPPSSNLLVTIVDNAGVTRAKMVPPARVDSIARKGMGLSPAFAGMCVDDHVIPLRPDMAVGDMRLVPDLAARRRISPTLDWAPVNQLDQSLEPMATCPRSAAQRLQDDAAARGYEYKMAFEFEFTLFEGDGGDEAVLAHRGPGYGLTPFLQLEPFILELADALADAGIEVEQIHPEYGQGQVEVSIGPTDPVTAADNSVVTRIVASRTALRHGLRASFAPITAANGIGNGAHLHVSAMHQGSNVFTDGDRTCGMTEAGLAMVSALARTLPDTVALFAPSVLSTDRLLPGMWSGAWVCWGPENREAGIRFIKGTVGHGQSAANCEVKVIEPAANPYLVVAAVMATTQDAISSEAPILDPIDTDPASLTDDECTRLGVGRLPGSLAESLDRLESNAVLRKALGDELIDSFVGVHRYEDDTYGARGLEERIDLLRWRY